MPHYAKNEDIIEFAHWVASQVCVSDDEWDLNQICFPELACRKLVKLGIIVEEDGKYWYEE